VGRIKAGNGLGPLGEAAHRQSRALCALAIDVRPFPRFPLDFDFEWFSLSFSADAAGSVAPRSVLDVWYDPISEQRPKQSCSQSSAVPLHRHQTRVGDHSNRFFFRLFHFVCYCQSDHHRRR
jgi:hypothetical protein